MRWINVMQEKFPQEPKTNGQSNLT